MPPNNSWLITLCIASLAGTFALDLKLPLGVAGGVPYVVVVLLAARLPGTRPVLMAALAGSVLTVLGYFLSAEVGIETWMVAVNRMVALLVIWCTALAMYSRQETSQRLEATEQLFQTLIDQAPYEICIHDLEGNILEVNRKC